ncbi:uncharacterized protein LOC107871784 [Capsicum annuum]|uniref:uncharacterized protein LOC107871784 n=1 Tax=Capsicum annuum TaxID=4072 RepID=UPI001FB0BCBE|nr:uncharacterized protein LOC107871784 [Capsicum annuum]
MKKLISKKKLVEGDTIEVTRGCSTIMDSKVTEKKDDPRALTIPCTIGTHKFAKALCDLANFIVLDSEMDNDVPIIICCPFLATGRAIIELELGEIKFQVQEDEVSFKISKSKKQIVELKVVSVVDVENEKVNDEGFEDLP